jgi:hypothetical protein
MDSLRLTTMTPASPRSARAHTTMRIPKQFYFRDGSFTDYGIIQPPNPAYHRVATGVEYQFGVDYSHLSADPAGTKGGGYLYAPGAPAVVWG